MKKFLKSIIFLLSLVLVLLISTIRSGPVWGKLDFLLVENKPWWPAWEPMIDKVLDAGSQPVLSDPMTSTVLRGVFGQDVVYSRTTVHDKILFVEKMSALNQPYYFPSGALTLLLNNAGDEDRLVAKIVVDYVNFIAEKKKNKITGWHPNAPYRCIINIRGFPSSWVPRETGHWSFRMADTKWFYRYNYGAVENIKQELENFPTENCEVFF